VISNVILSRFYAQHLGVCGGGSFGSLYLCISNNKYCIDHRVYAGADPGGGLGGQLTHSFLTQLNVAPRKGKLHKHFFI